jgi:hypothetical protein
VEAEAKQLHWHNSFKPVHYKEIDKDQWKQILQSLFFIKKKPSGQIKAHKVASREI